MNEQGVPPDNQEIEQLRQELRMGSVLDEAHLEAERRHLGELEKSGGWTEMKGYARLSGPGYLQSAMTLGGGTAAASLFAGAAFGYQLLWVAPVAMLFGVVMLSAISHQTLSTGLRPFPAMVKHAGKTFAWGWAIGALISSVIWHFPQYALASAVMEDMGEAMGFSLRREWMGLLVLVWAILLSSFYGSSPRAIRLYERTLKYMVWLLVLCFGAVVFKTGVQHWGDLARGFIPSIPASKGEVVGWVVVLSAVTAAVGVNMVFLYPYTLLARGWSREHRRLARFDLWGGMFLPYFLATTLMLIATANTFYYPEVPVGTGLAPVKAAQVIGNVAGPTVGRVLFDLGVLAMALSSITLHMLCAGFVAYELFNWKVGTWKHRLATLIPIPGVLGCVFWQDIAVWVAVPTNVICGIFLPLAYLGFIRLQRNRDYLGEDLPRGPWAKAWIAVMMLGTLLLILALVRYMWTKGPVFFDRMGSLF